MEGILEIKEISNNTSKYLSYSSLISKDQDTKKNKLHLLYEEFRHKRIELFCKCSINEIQMTMGYIADSDSYYIRSFPKQAELHNDFCHFHTTGTLSSLSVYKKNCEEDTEGNFYVYLNPHDYKKIKKSNNNNTKLGISESNGISLSRDKMSTYQLLRFIVTKTWNDYIFFKGNANYPDLKLIFDQIISYTTKKVLLPKNVRLKDLLYSGGKIGKLYYIQKEYSNNYPFMVYPFHNLEELDFDFMLQLINPKSNEVIKAKVEKRLLKKAFNYEHLSKGPCFVGGFVKYNSQTEPIQFISIGIVPINNYGAPIESSYERFLYNLLCDERRLIQRPFDSNYHPKWNGLIPDGLLIDTNPPTIIEVFGMSVDNEAYHVQRHIKIKHYSQINKFYSFWYWDAFDKSEIAPLPEKESIN